MSISVKRTIKTIIFYVAANQESRFTPSKEL